MDFLHLCLLTRLLAQHLLLDLCGFGFWSEDLRCLTVFFFYSSYHNLALGKQ